MSLGGGRWASSVRPHGHPLLEVTPGSGTPVAALPPVLLRPGSRRLPATPRRSPQAVLPVLTHTHTLSPSPSPGSYARLILGLLPRHAATAPASPVFPGTTQAASEHRVAVVVPPEPGFGARRQREEDLKGVGPKGQQCHALPSLAAPSSITSHTNPGFLPHPQQPVATHTFVPISLLQGQAVTDDWSEAQAGCGDAGLTRDGHSSHPFPSAPLPAATSRPHHGLCSLRHVPTG